MMLIYYAIDLDMISIDLNRVEVMQRFSVHHQMKVLEEKLNDLYHLKYHRENSVDLQRRNKRF
jgi:hypothetical protein